MKTLDLNAYGVHEMNAVEMQNTDGGLCFFAAVLTVVAISYLIPPVWR
ncbi:MAG: hypothetical protein LBO71_06565 [Prevotellaceae bacterium]|jgi:hypothetical protein|nr:hypothetical protein [Prevotellaceae bacterium]